MLEKEEKKRSNNKFLELITASKELAKQPWILTKPGIFLPLHNNEKKLIELFDESNKRERNPITQLAYEFEHHVAYFERIFGEEPEIGLHFYAKPEYKFQLGRRVQKGIIMYTSEHIHPKDGLFKNTDMKIRPNETTIGALEDFLTYNNQIKPVIVKKHALERYQQKVKSGIIQKRFALQELIQDLSTSEEVQRKNLLELPVDRWTEDIYFKGQEGLYCFKRTQDNKKLILTTCYSAIDPSIKKKYLTLN